MFHMGYLGAQASLPAVDSALSSPGLGGAAGAELIQRQGPKGRHPHQGSSSPGLAEALVPDRTTNDSSARRWSQGRRR